MLSAYLYLPFPLRAVLDDYIINGKDYGNVTVGIGEEDRLLDGVRKAEDCGFKVSLSYRWVKSDPKEGTTVSYYYKI